MIVTELTEEELDVFIEAIKDTRQDFIEKYGEEASTAFQIE